MTTQPIPPDEVERPVSPRNGKALIRLFNEANAEMKASAGFDSDGAGIAAVALAVCPPGHIVVRRDDLRHLVGMYRTGTRSMASDDKVLDRLRAVLEE